MKKKVALTITSIALVAAMAIGGTFAWLTAQSQAVTNTFIASAGITQLTLDESKYENGALNTSERVQANSYTMVPGETYPKDPTVTIATAVESYVFVQIEEKNELDTYINYAIAEGWTQLNDSNVYYQTVAPTTGDAVTSIYLLAGGADANTTGQVTVNNVTLPAMTAENAPALAFKAYAIQTSGFENDAAGAWAAAQAAANSQQPQA